MATNIYDGYAVGQEGNYGHLSNWSLGHVPIAGEHVIIPASAGAITSGLAQSAVELLSWTREAGHSQQIGNSQDDPLELDIDGAGAFFDHAGTGDAWIDLGISDCAPRIRGTGNGIGGYGLLLMGTTLTGLVIDNGNVKLIAVNSLGLEVRGGTVFADRDCVLTGTSRVCSCLSGTLVIECTADIIRNSGGSITIDGLGTVASILCDSGTIVCSTTGTVTLAQADGSGVIDFTQSNFARTVTSMARSGDGILKFDPDRITLTNPPTSDGKMQLQKAS